MPRLQLRPPLIPAAVTGRRRRGRLETAKALHRLQAAAEGLARLHGVEAPLRSHGSKWLQRWRVARVMERGSDDVVAMRGRCLALVVYDCSKRSQLWREYNVAHH
mmetsp:Transcript_12687/g.22446  ORF Transcript_12687/g.22446 Transcript_12687/m.22446 type:complete len:105 (-) Transcript_12687:37-351(-)